MIDIVAGIPEVEKSVYEKDIDDKEELKEELKDLNEDIKKATT
mgnify:CR=1 FL=1